MPGPLRLNRRSVLAGAGALSGWALSGCAREPAPSAGGALRIASYKGGARTLLDAAGLANTPYRIEWSEFAGGNLITEAIEAGAVDIGSMSEIPPIFVAGRPTRLRIVAVQRGDVNAQVTLVPKASPIRTAADLKGKRVGYVRATTSQYFLARLLAEQGLTLGDIQAVALSPQDGLSAFTQGALDAWVIYGVQGNLARARLGARVLATGLGRLSGNYVQSALADALDDPARRAAIADHLQRLRKAYAWANAHPESWAAAQAAATGVPAEIYEALHRERSAPSVLGAVDAEAIASQQAVADAFADLKVIPARVDVRPMWSREFDEEIKI
ncbi:ABC transporter substrate-binding protein [Phenylobacterium sp.]|uniref:ABC transporter substrate-binding protein n=1 Tax=Phenylobacterium sp. TaxID=1871053 RepID=UPI00301CE783